MTIVDKTGRRQQFNTELQTRTLFHVTFIITGVRYNLHSHNITTRGENIIVK